MNAATTSRLTITSKGADSRITSAGATLSAIKSSGTFHGSTAATTTGRGARRNRGDRPRPARPQRHDVRTLCSRGVENPFAQLRRRGSLGSSGVGERFSGTLELGEFSPTLLAVSEVRLVGFNLLR